MEQVRWCEGLHPLVPSMSLSSLLFLAVQTSVDGSIEQKGMDLTVVAAYLCHVGEKAAAAMTMLEQCIKQQLYLFTRPAVGSSMPPFLSQQEKGWNAIQTLCSFPPV